MERLLLRPALAEVEEYLLDLLAVVEVVGYLDLPSLGEEEEYLLVLPSLEEVEVVECLLPSSEEEEEEEEE